MGRTILWCLSQHTCGDLVRKTPRQLVNFCLVGVVNTVIGFGTIAVAQLLFGLHPVLANIIGYAAGLTNSYLMNRAFTFSEMSHASGSAFRFVVAFVIAYGANMAVLLAGLRTFTDHVLLLQGLAMVIYTIIFFVISKIYVFRSPT